MGQPAFELKELIRKENVACFSSNYTLFGDMSSRVMRTLARFTPEMEVYSIDEAFLDFSNMPFGLFEYAREIKATLKKNVGVPVGIRIGETKVLAKVANHIAKKHPDFKDKGVFVLDPEVRERVLSEFAIEDVWGIGSRFAHRLHSVGVKTAGDFTSLPEHWVKKEMSVVGLRIYRELKGQSCLPLELFSKARKQIITSRSFPTAITKFESVSEAVSNFAAKCAFKLRSETTAANLVTVFIGTNRFDSKRPYYSNSVTLTLPIAANDGPTIIRYALQGLKLIYKPEFGYKKAGVLVSGIIPEGARQTSLFEQPDEKKQAAMEAMDRLNSYMGNEKVKIASQGFDRSWGLKAERLPDCYTTRWDQLIRIK